MHHAPCIRTRTSSGALGRTVPCRRCALAGTLRAASSLAVCTRTSPRLATRACVASLLCALVHPTAPLTGKRHPPERCARTFSGRCVLHCRLVLRRASRCCPLLTLARLLLSRRLQGSYASIRGPNARPLSAGFMLAISVAGDPCAAHQGSWSPGGTCRSCQRFVGRTKLTPRTADAFALFFTSVAGVTSPHGSSGACPGARRRQDARKNQSSRTALLRRCFEERSGVSASQATPPSTAA